MRKLTDHDLANIASMTVNGYHVDGVRIKRGSFSDSDHYGIILGNNLKGKCVTWQFHLDEMENPTAYWGHYFDDYDAALQDFCRRDLDSSSDLSSDYWDCQCDEKYIHSNNVAHCSICGAIREEMPDSRQDEVNEGTHFAQSSSNGKRFSVAIIEKLQKVVIVEAETSDEAKEIVTDEWKSCLHVLGPENFIEAEFEAIPIVGQDDLPLGSLHKPFIN